MLSTGLTGPDDAKYYGVRDALPDANPPVLKQLKVSRQLARKISTLVLTIWQLESLFDTTDNKSNNQFIIKVNSKGQEYLTLTSVRVSGKSSQQCL